MDSGADSPSPDAGNGKKGLSRHTAGTDRTGLRVEVKMELRAQIQALGSRKLSLLKEHGVERFNSVQRQFWAEYDEGRYTPESLAPVREQLDQISAEYEALMAG